MKQERKKVKLLRVTAYAEITEDKVENTQTKNPNKFYWDFENFSLLKVPVKCGITQYLG